MGAWGEGLFENDGALDCAGDVIESFCDSIDEWLVDAVRGEKSPDDRMSSLESNIGPLVFMLFKVCETTGACPPDPARIESWRHQFLTGYVELASESWGRESALNRKAMFDKMFADFLKLSESFHNG